MSTLPRISLLLLPLAFAACSPEQSKAIGDQPKKTLDRANTNLDKSMQQGADRVKDADK